MNQEEFSKLKDPLVIDIREDYEVKAGMIPGAEHIPMAEVQNRLDELKDKEPVIYCETGSRSGFLVKMLKFRGINAYNLEGGYSGWLAFNNKL